MLKKWLIGLFTTSVLLCSIHQPTAAATAVEAPGGQVSSYEELGKALGGEAAVRIEENHLLILSDIRLSAPVVITEGQYMLLGAGIEITASFDASAFFCVEGKDTALSFGSSGTQGDQDNLVLNGENKTRSGSLLTIGNDATVTIFGGTALRNHTTSVSGGAIFNEGTFAMYGGTIEDCSSVGAGGAIDSRGSVIFSSGVISGCSAEFGGALYNEGKASLAGTEFKDCRATKGGAVFNAGDLEMLSSSISSCKATQGAGLYNSGTAALKGGQIVSCLAENGEGGGIYNSGTLTMSGTYLKDNSAKNGGSLYNVAEATLAEGLLLAGNATEAGGNVYNDANGTVKLTGCSISVGKAKYGGGVFNLGTLTLSGGVINSNKADCGKGVLNDGKLSILEFVDVYDNNDIFIVTDDEASHAISLENKLNDVFHAVLTPGCRTENGYEIGYVEGAKLLAGSHVSAGYARFSVSPNNGEEWLLTEDGTLIPSLPVYRQAWFYLVLIGAFALTVALMVTGIRYLDKKRSS